MVSKLVLDCPNGEEEPKAHTPLDLNSAKNEYHMNHTRSVDDTGIEILAFHILINAFNQHGQIERNS